MGGGDYGHALVCHHFSEEAEDGLGIVGVEFAGRFVGEDYVGSHGDGASDGDTLLFTA